MTILEVIRELGIPIAPEGHHHTTEGWVNIDCPYCSLQTRRWRLGIPTDRPRVASCWTCGSHPLYESLSLASGVRIGLVAGMCRGLAQDSRPERPVETGRLVVPPGVGKLKGAHRRYLNLRGLDPAEVEMLWKVQGIGIASRLQWRLFIPILYCGETVSFTTRSISSDTEVPYLTAQPHEEKIHHRKLLYGEDHCRHCIIVNEGPMDVWAIGPGAVATLGLGHSQAQVLRMSKYPLRVILFDNEPEAQRRARKLADSLAVFDGETHNVTLETGKDAIRADKEEIRELRKRFLS